MNLREPVIARNPTARDFTKLAALAWRLPSFSLPTPLYARLMEQTRDIELVKVADGGRELDGIVLDAPSKSKVTVAVMDPVRGPVFRTVHPDTLTDRTEPGPDDRALSLLIRRTWQGARGGSAPGGAGATRGLDGHTRAAMHRTTGK